MIRRGLGAVALALAALALMAASAAAAARGTVSVLAPVPSPGYPALPHVVGDQIYEGTYSNPMGDSLPSRVYRYSADGHLERTYVVTGQDLSQPHGVQVAASDAAGRLLLLDKTSGRVISLDPQTGTQTVYSRVPDLPICTVAVPGAACSPAIIDQAPMPDYAAWGPDGSLYVTDYQQAVIWRIPPGGGTATVWLADRRLDGGPFGTACITLLPDQHTLLFDQASNGGLGSTSPSTGKLYEVAIGAGGRPGPLRQIWESGSADAPDGCALSSDGHVYIALVGGPNQIVELDFDRARARPLRPGGHGRQRLSGALRLPVRTGLRGDAADRRQPVLFRRRSRQPGAAVAADRRFRTADLRARRRGREAGRHAPVAPDAQADPQAQAQEEAQKERSTAGTASTARPAGAELPARVGRAGEQAEPNYTF